MCVSECHRSGLHIIYDSHNQINWVMLYFYYFRYKIRYKNKCLQLIAKSFHLGT